MEERRGRGGGGEARRRGEGGEGREGRGKERAGRGGREEREGGGEGGEGREERKYRGGEEEGSRREATTNGFTFIYTHYAKIAPAYFHLEC